MAKIYVQSHVLQTEGYLPDYISSSGEEMIKTDKSFISNKKNWGLVFLITSGKYDEYIDCNFPEPSILPNTEETIYFLWSKFHIERAEEFSEYPYSARFGVYGRKRAKNFNSPFVVLNERNGFEEFSQRFLRTGLTNVAKNWPPEPEFSDTLLEISGENPFVCK